MPRRRINPLESSFQQTISSLNSFVWQHELQQFTVLLRDFNQHTTELGTEVCLDQRLNELIQRGQELLQTKQDDSNLQLENIQQVSVGTQVENQHFVPLVNEQTLSAAEPIKQLVGGFDLYDKLMEKHPPRQARTSSQPFQFPGVCVPTDAAKKATQRKSPTFAFQSTNTDSNSSINNQLQINAVNSQNNGFNINQLSQQLGGFTCMDTIQEEGVAQNAQLDQNITVQSQFNSQGEFLPSVKETSNRNISEKQNTDLGNQLCMVETGNCREMMSDYDQGQNNYQDNNKVSLCIDKQQSISVCKAQENLQTSKISQTSKNDTEINIHVTAQTNQLQNISPSVNNQQISQLTNNNDYLKQDEQFRGRDGGFVFDNNFASQQQYQNMYKNSEGFESPGATQVMDDDYVPDTELLPQTKVLIEPCRDQEKDDEDDDILQDLYATKQLHFSSEDYSVKKSMHKGVDEGGYKGDFEDVTSGQLLPPILEHDQENSNPRGTKIPDTHVITKQYDNSVDLVHDNNSEFVEKNNHQLDYYQSVLNMQSQALSHNNSQKQIQQMQPTQNEELQSYQELYRVEQLQYDQRQFQQDQIYQTTNYRQLLENQKPEEYMLQQQIQSEQQINYTSKVDQLLENIAQIENNSQDVQKFERTQIEQLQSQHANQVINQSSNQEKFLQQQQTNDKHRECFSPPPSKLKQGGLNIFSPQPRSRNIFTPIKPQQKEQQDIGRKSVTFNCKEDDTILTPARNSVQVELDDEINKELNYHKMADTSARAPPELTATFQEFAHSVKRGSGVSIPEGNENTTKKRQFSIYPVQEEPEEEEVVEPLHQISPPLQNSSSKKRKLQVESLSGAKKSSKSSGKNSRSRKSKQQNNRFQASITDFYRPQSRQLSFSDTAQKQNTNATTPTNNNQNSQIIDQQDNSIKIGTISPLLSSVQDAQNNQQTPTPVSWTPSTTSQNKQNNRTVLQNQNLSMQCCDGDINENMEQIHFISHVKNNSVVEHQLASKDLFGGKQTDEKENIDQVNIGGNEENDNTTVIGTPKKQSFENKNRIDQQDIVNFSPLSASIKISRLSDEGLKFKKTEPILTNNFSGKLNTSKLYVGTDLSPVKETEQVSQKEQFENGRFQNDGLPHLQKQKSFSIQQSSRVFSGKSFSQFKAMDKNLGTVDDLKLQTHVGLHQIVKSEKQQKPLENQDFGKQFSKLGVKQDFAGVEEQAGNQKSIDQEKLGVKVQHHYNRIIGEEMGGDSCNQIHSSEQQICTVQETFGLNLTSKSSQLGTVPQIQGTDYKLHSQLKQPVDQYSEGIAGQFPSSSQQQENQGKGKRNNMVSGFRSFVQPKAEVQKMAAGGKAVLVPALEQAKKAKQQEEIKARKKQEEKIKRSQKPTQEAFKRPTAKQKIVASGATNSSRLPPKAPQVNKGQCANPKLLGVVQPFNSSIKQNTPGQQQQQQQQQYQKVIKRETPSWATDAQIQRYFQLSISKLNPSDIFEIQRGPIDISVYNEVFPYLESRQNKRDRESVEWHGDMYNTDELERNEQCRGYINNDPKRQKINKNYNDNK